MENIKITAATGKIFRRKIDGMEMGNEIFLGYDFSTGEKRIDLPEYYEEISDPNQVEQTPPEQLNKYVITAPKQLISLYPELLFDLAVRRKLPIVEDGETLLIYCNWIDPEHLQFINNSNGVITISEIE